MPHESPSALERSSPHPAYRPDIDGLRAVAVGSVLTYHAFPSLLPGGYVGVDIFFAISGFLISTIIFAGLESGRFSFSDFYARRVRRIFPALLLVLFSCLICGWWFLLADEYQQLGKHVAAGAGFLSNLVLWGDSGYFDPAASQKPLIHLWSLGIEEQFYLIWPVLLWFAYLRHRSFLWLTVAIAVASFAVNVLTVRHYPVAAFYFPMSRFWELMMGGILAYIVRHWPGFARQWSDAAACLGLVLIGIALFFLKNDSLFPGWWALLPSLGSFLILFAGRDAWFSRHVLGSRLMVGIGLISYPLYLWHWPLLFLASQWGNVPSRVLRLAAVVLSIVLATLTYFLVEKPVRRFSSARWLTPGLTIIMLVCGSLGILTYLNDGFGFRVPPQFAHYTQSSLDTLHTDCFLRDQSSFPEKCTALTRRPAVFVWGDSYADRLYWGLEPLASQGRISELQVTGASCPPFLNKKSGGNRACEEINRYALQAIQRTKPNVVVLDANWTSDTIDLKDIDATVDELKMSGVRSIVLLGPVPRWNGTLLSSLFRCWHPRDSAEPFPTYSSCGLDPKVALTDRRMREQAGRLQVDYISPYEVFCTADGCLTHFEDQGDELESYDSGHMSKAASKYLINKIAPELLKDTNG